MHLYLKQLICMETYEYEKLLIHELSYNHTFYQTFNTNEL